MHPEIAKTIAALRAEELQAAAAAARQHRAGRAAASLPLTGSGSAAAVGGRNARRQRLLGRWVPARLRPA